MIDKKTEQTLLKVADYESHEKQRFSRRVCGLFIAAIVAFILYAALNATTGFWIKPKRKAEKKKFRGFAVGSLR